MKNVFESEGEIREVDPLAALVTCWRERTTGALRFTRGASECGFDLDEGEVVAVVSSDPRFETAAILVRAGKLSTEAVERLAPQGGDAALAALQTGLLTRREWKWGEKIRAIEVLSDLLTWNDGRYAFDAAARPKAGDFRVPVPRLLLELFLRSRDRNLVDHQIGSPEQTLVRGERFDAEFQSFGLTADAESVVRLIDGRSTAAEIAEKAPAEEFAVRKLLAALVTLGLVHPVPVAPPRPAERVPERDFEPEPFSEAEPPPPASTDEFAATLDLPPREEHTPTDFETEMPAVENVPMPEADQEMVDLPSAPASPLDRFEPGPPAGPWEAEAPRPPSEGPWGYAPESPQPPDSGEPPAPSGGGVSPLVWALARSAGRRRGARDLSRPRHGSVGNHRSGGADGRRGRDISSARHGVARRGGFQRDTAGDACRSGTDRRADHGRHTVPDRAPRHPRSGLAARGEGARPPSKRAPRPPGPSGRPPRSPRPPGRRGPRGIAGGWRGTGARSIRSSWSWSARPLRSKRRGGTTATRRCGCSR